MNDKHPELGDFVASYPIKHTALLASLVASLPAVCCFLAFPDIAQDDKDIGSFICLIPCLLPFFLPLFYAFPNWIKNWNIPLRVFSLGMIYDTQTIFWQDIANINHSRHGLLRYFDIHLKNGQQLHISEQRRNFDILAKLVETRIAENMLSNALEKIQEGSKIYFNNEFFLDRDGIHTGALNLHWSEVGDCTLSHKELAIFALKGHQLWYQTAPENIQNPSLALHLIDRMKTQQAKFQEVATQSLADSSASGSRAFYGSFISSKRDLGVIGFHFMMLFGASIFLSLLFMEDTRSASIGSILLVLGLASLPLMALFNYRKRMKLIRSAGGIQHLSIDEAGFTITTKQYIRNLYWEDVTEITMLAAIFGLPKSVYRIADREGNVYYLDEYLEDLSELEAVLLNIGGGKLLDRALKTLELGGKIQIGELKISSAGISNESEYIAWGDAKNVTAKEIKWIKVERTDPNAFLFYALVEYFLGGGESSSESAPKG